MLAAYGQGDMDTDAPGPSAPAPHHPPKKKPARPAKKPRAAAAAAAAGTRGARACMHASTLAQWPLLRVADAQALLSRVSCALSDLSGPAGCVHAMPHAPQPHAAPCCPPPSCMVVPHV
jgi:hypothetical protein